MARQPVGQGDIRPLDDNHDASPQPTDQTLTNIFSDGFALEPLQVSDGFRPSTSPSQPPANTPSNLTRQSSTRAITPAIPPKAHHAPSSDDKASKRFPRFSAARNSFTLRHDGPGGHLNRRFSNPTSTPSVPARSASMSSTSTHIRAQSPFQQQGGPSFPYALYPQQNTIPEGDPRAGPATAIPVGFPGHLGTYQASYGPSNGDTGDIVGPYGHTEQLPPYSKYPDGVRPAARNSVAETPPRSAGTENPFDTPAHSPIDSPNQRDSRISARSLTSDSSRDQTTAVPSNEPSDNGSGGMKEKFKEKSRRRLCGLPLWVIIVAVVLLVLIGCLLGGLLGAFLGHKSAEEDDAESIPTPKAQSTAVPTVTITKTFDATPLGTSPPDLPLLPTGTYKLPLSRPNKNTNACLRNPYQMNAWSCQTADRDHSIISITGPFTSRGLPQLTLTYTGPNDKLQYGAQPPRLANPQPLILVTDTDEPGYGPAHFFQTSYDKQVLVSGDMLAFSSKSKKRLRFRERRELADPGLNRRSPSANPSRYTHPTSTAASISPSQTPGSLAKPADQPWLCIWNNTLLEGFVYTKMNSSSSAGDPGCFPKLVKLEERRNPDAVGSAPFCLRMQVLDNGSLNPVIDPSTNAPEVLTLDESRVPWGSKQNAAAVHAREYSDAEQCHCEWVAPPSSVTS